MSIVTLTYTCPVYVDVDTRAGRVVGVVVDDTAAELQQADRESTNANMAMARRTADVEDWPAWELGY